MPCNQPVGTKLPRQESPQESSAGRPGRTSKGDPSALQRAIVQQGVNPVSFGLTNEWNDTITSDKKALFGTFHERYDMIPRPPLFALRVLLWDSFDLPDIANGPLSSLLRLLARDVLIYIWCHGMTGMSGMTPLLQSRTCDKS